MSALQVIALGFIVGVCVTAALSVAFMPQIRAWHGRANLYRNPESTGWTDRNCSQRELQAIENVALGIANDLDREYARKVASRAPQFIADYILMALGE